MQHSLSYAMMFLLKVRMWVNTLIYEHILLFRPSLLRTSST